MRGIFPKKQKNRHGLSKIHALTYLFYHNANIKVNIKFTTKHKQFNVHYKSTFVSHYAHSTKNSIKHPSQSRINTG